jgi:hypothetical protein
MHFSTLQHLWSKHCLYLNSYSNTKKCIFRSPESLRWPIAIRFSSYFWTFLAFSLEPLNQFQPDFADSIHGWRGTKILNFMVPAPLGPWEWGKNYPKLTNFQKSSSLHPHMWRKNWMHGDVEQEGFYLNCEIYNPRCSGFAPKAGPNMIYSVCYHLNFFNFLITFAWILFKFDMMHLWDKGDLNCEFQVSCPPVAFGAGRKVSKWQILKKSFSLKLHVCKKN